MKTTRIEGYLIGFAVAESNPEPVSLFLYDLPGCGVQAKTFPEAMAKLSALVPEYLRSLRERGVTLPEPSPDPAFQFEEMVWDSSIPVAGMELQQVQGAQPVAVVRKADGVQQVEIGRPVFGIPVPA
jgi:predicted RNase H-like HicB family nuclease